LTLGVYAKTSHQAKKSVVEALPDPFATKSATGGVSVPSLESAETQRLQADWAESDIAAATVLRSAQAFPRNRPCDAIGRADRDPPGLDLLLAEEPSLAGGEPRQGDGQWQQVEELPIPLL